VKLREVADIFGPQHARICRDVDTAARLLKLLSLLQARSVWTGTELADRLGVTTRTLRRDMSRLREHGYPVAAEPGPHGGYRLVAGGALPPLLLDDDDAIAVALAMRGAAAGALPGFEDSAVVALAKIEQVLPARLRKRVETLADATVRLQSPSANRPLKVDDLVAIAQACRTPERLRFTYIDGSGRTTERHVEPYQLVHAGRRWYLVARDRDREAWRTFRVDRISSPVPTGMRVVHQDPPDAADFVAEGAAVGAYTYQARVLLRVPREEAAMMVHPMIGILEPADGGTLLRIGADDLAWIAHYLASLHCRFTVLDPPALAEAVAALATRLAEDASSGN
jgi:predicted DNA-binding transcriptional regulator YafY